MENYLSKQKHFFVLMVLVLLLTIITCGCSSNSAVEPAKNSSESFTKTETSSTESSNDTAKDEQAETNSSIRSEIKDAIDKYANFVDKYCDFMDTYDAKDLSKLSEFTSLLTEESKMLEEFETLKDSNMNTAELAYYSEVSLRCSQKLADSASKLSAQSTDETVGKDNTDSSDSKDGDVRTEIKDAIDSYEAFVDEYCEFMEDYDKTDLSKLADYTALLTKELTMQQKFDELQDADLNTAELNYYTEVSLRCSQKLLDCANKIN